MALDFEDMKTCVRLRGMVVLPDDSFEDYDNGDYFLDNVRTEIEELEVGIEDCRDSWGESA